MGIGFIVIFIEDQRSNEETVNSWMVYKYGLGRHSRLNKIFSFLVGYTMRDNGLSQSSE